MDDFVQTSVISKWENSKNDEQKKIGIAADMF